MVNGNVSTLSSILSTARNSPPVVLDSSGNYVNQGCEGVLDTIDIASYLLEGGERVSGPSRLALLFWNQAPATSKTDFPGDFATLN